MLGESHSKKKYILYDSIYIQFRNSQKLRVKVAVITLGGRRIGRGAA